MITLYNGGPVTEVVTLVGFTVYISVSAINVCMYIYSETCVLRPPVWKYQSAIKDRFGLERPLAF